MAEKNAETSVMVENFWCHTRYVERQSTFIWKIGNFRLCKEKISEFIAHGDYFYMAGDRKRGWELNLYPKGVLQEYSDFVSVFLDSDSYEDMDIPMSVELCLLNASGEKYNCKTFSDVSKITGRLGFKKFIALAELMDDKNHLLPNDELTISCMLTTTEKVVGDVICGELKWPQLPSRFPELRGQALSDDFLKLYQDMKFFDVILNCGKTEIQAHKIFLAFRSSAFAAMLKLNMLDADKITLDISDVDGEVLQEVVHYIYSDGCSFYDVNFVLKLLDAANRFGIPSLESRCEEYLNDKISSGNVFDIVMLVDDKGHLRLRQNCVRFICDQMSSGTLSYGWESKLHSKPRILEEILQHFGQKHSAT